VCSTKMTGSSYTQRVRKSDAALGFVMQDSRAGFAVYLLSMMRLNRTDN
jgi:hypothetical protein